MSEDEFWRSPPRKLSSLFNQYINHQKVINGIVDEDNKDEMDIARQNKKALDQLQSLSRR